MYLHAHTTAPDIQMMTQLIGHEKVAFCPQDKTWLYNPRLSLQAVQSYCDFKDANALLLLAFKPLHLGFLISF
jgi:hypothetical protein